MSSISAGSFEEVSGRAGIFVLSVKHIGHLAMEDTRFTK